MAKRGSLIADRYRVDKELGRGAAGVVLACEDMKLRRPVAVKLVENEILGGKDRFLEEAKALAVLKHPHIVELFDFGLADGQPYLVMEWLRGGALQDKLYKGPLPPDVVLRIADQLLDALDYAHSNGVFHRDVKPENVMLDAEGDAKLADFGCAKGPSSQVKTGTGLVIGTPEFMAPELFQDARANAATDLYSWGCLVYAMVNGKPPHTGSLTQVVRACVRGEVRRGVEKGPLALAIYAALRVDPGTRADVRQLRGILAGDSGIDLQQLATVAIVSDLVAPPRAAVHSGLRGRVGSSLAPTPRRNLGWRAGAAVSAAVAMVTLGYFVAPSQTQPASASHRVDVTSQWITRGREFQTSAVVQKLHRAVGGKMSYRGDMYQVREQGTPPASLGLDFAALAEVELPWLEELRDAAGDIRRVLLDETLDADERIDLFESLRGFAHVDTYFLAWGKPPPYRARELRQAFVPEEISPYEMPPRNLPDGSVRLTGNIASTLGKELPPGDDPGTERCRIFEWKDPSDREFP